MRQLDLRPAVGARSHHHQPRLAQISREAFQRGRVGQCECPAGGTPVRKRGDELAEQPAHIVFRRGADDDALPHLLGIPCKRPGNAALVTIGRVGENAAPLIFPEQRQGEVPVQYQKL